MKSCLSTICLCSCRFLCCEWDNSEKCWISNPRLICSKIKKYDWHVWNGACFTCLAISYVFVCARMCVYVQIKGSAKENKANEARIFCCILWRFLYKIAFAWFCWPYSQTNISLEFFCSPKDSTHFCDCWDVAGVLCSSAVLSVLLFSSNWLSFLLASDATS